MTAMRTVADALADILALVAPTSAEDVALEHAAGRVLAAPVAARIAHPNSTVSAMDGYAVRSSDAAEGATLRVVGTIYAGPYEPVRIGPGEVARVFTGSTIPAGADAIALQEHATRAGDTVTLARAVGRDAFVRPEGLDFRRGTALLHAPRRLAPEDLALAAAANHARLAVARRPRVLLLPTGDELVQPGQDPAPGQVIASTGIGVAALLERQGAAVSLQPPVADDPDALRRALAETDADLVVTLGGASVGERDLVGRELARQELELAFHGVAMRPGKPMLAGRLGGRPLVGLPGNPVSAMVCTQVFLRPAIDACLGLPAGPRTRHHARLGCDLPEGGAREHYMRARLERNPAGPVCTPLALQDSSMLHNLSRADALAIHPARAPACNAGADIEFIRM